MRRSASLLLATWLGACDLGAGLPDVTGPDLSGDWGPWVDPTLSTWVEGTVTIGGVPLSSAAARVDFVLDTTGDPYVFRSLAVDSVDGSFGADVADLLVCSDQAHVRAVYREAASEPEQASGYMRLFDSPPSPCPDSLVVLIRVPAG